MNPDIMVLYVGNPSESARFYGNILGKQPMESSPGFAMFELRPGMMLGLWCKEEVAPAANQPGGFEFGLSVEADSDIDGLAKDWAGRGIAIAQQPQDMDFGRTFTALDPDGHRVRVYKPALRQ
jgi:predicted enzyme related to lactoylglutathione lyase